MATAAMTILAILIVLALSIAAAVFCIYALYKIHEFTAWANRTLSNKLDEVEERFAARSRHEEIEAELQSRKRTHKSGKRVDQVIVEAAEATQEISIGLKMVKEATATCCELQLLTADMTGVSHMEEIEWNPMCATLRENVLETMAVTLDHLDSYPMINRKVLKQGMMIRGFHTICEDCELLKYQRQDAPRLCRPAALMGNKTDDDPSDRKTDREDG